MLRTLYFFVFFSLGTFCASQSVADEKVFLRRVISMKTGHLVHEFSSGNFLITSVCNGVFYVHDTPMPGAESVTYTDSTNKQHTFKKASESLYWILVSENGKD